MDWTGRVFGGSFPGLSAGAGVVEARLSRLTEAVQMSTHSMCLCWAVGGIVPELLAGARLV